MTAFGVADLHAVLVDVDGGEHVLAGHPLADHDGILEVVSLPWHEGHHEIAADGQLSVLGTVAFAERLPRGHLFALADDGAQVHAGALVGLHELGELVLLLVTIKAHGAFVIGALVLDHDLLAVHVFHRAVAFCGKQYTAVVRH